MKHIPEEKNSHALGIGLGIAALAAAAAGAYYLYGSDKSAKNRKHVKSWMLKMKADVMDEVENMKDITKEAYEKTVDEVSKKYAQIKSIDAGELKDLGHRMKSHWSEIQEDIKDTIGSEMKKISKK